MSSDQFAIRVEGLGKRYVVPHRADDTSRARLLRHLKGFIPSLRHDERDYFWALRDLSFEVKPGEIVGILGKNGSGKSTLLKILSQVTLPTEGRALLRGRVGSLLEVGTGFHPDLTGRENVFMSGALLGLGRKHIAKRFDEIVDFSGIEQFIDVPVKHYSSGMYVRLAYAVASLLQSDILILDEVMAVGDAAFREKSQKNIEKIASDGRTILFVSHDIQAIRNMCQTAILLSKGEKIAQGEVEDVATHYMRLLHGLGEVAQTDISELPPFVSLTGSAGWDGERSQAVLTGVETADASGNAKRLFSAGETVLIRISYALEADLDSTYFTVFFIDEYGNRAQSLYSLHDVRHEISTGRGGVVECRIDDLRLTDGVYSLTLDFGHIVDGHLRSIDCVPDATQIRVSLGDYLGPLGLRPNQGVLAQRSHWRLLEGGTTVQAVSVG